CGPAPPRPASWSSRCRARRAPATVLRGARPRCVADRRAADRRPDRPEVGEAGETARPTAVPTAVPIAAPQKYSSLTHLLPFPPAGADPFFARTDIGHDSTNRRQQRQTRKVVVDNQRTGSADFSVHPSGLSANSPVRETCRTACPPRRSAAPPRRAAAAAEHPRR